ncbi:MAG: DMT family transporter [Dinoroseobacter sp.]|nr:DMT family transporter [Dinoroseobacter sp.]
MSHPDRPVLGILLMLGFCVLAPLGDGLAKYIGTAVPLAILLLVRFGAQVILLAPVVALWGLRWRYSGRVLRLVVYRTLLHIAGIGMMFLSLRFLPLAEAIAIAFVMPFIMLLLGKYVLGEEVGHRRLIACVVGFIGTLMVVQPSFAEVGLPALLPMAVAVVFALFMLVTRQIAQQVDPIALQAVSGAIATGILLVLMLLVGADTGDMALVAPPVDLWPVLLVIGVIGTMAHLLMTWALKFAPSATLAPMQYLEIPFATIIGWLFFRDFPNGLAALGIAVTIATGLYIVYREQLGSRAAKTLPADPIDP